ncbi:hypothetical protein BGX34_006494 [Mortierella sp. NVP85]|nr:hypothetical protein BGX34_006494 [Mortierella sp. NVP85]
MEEVTQSFCLAGETDIIDILCDNVNGQNVVHWIDIEQIFPGVKYVKRGNIAVTFMKDPNLNRSIKHYPGVVLDVVLSTSNEPTTVRRTNNSTNATLQQQNLPSDNGDNTNTTLTSNQVVKYVQKEDVESDVEQLLAALPPSDSQSKALTSSTPDALVQAIKDGHLNRLGEQMIVRLQDLKDEVAKNNELASKNNDLASKNNELASKNNELASKNNELASKNNELASKITELVLENNQVGYENKELLIRLNDLQKVLDSKQDEMKELQIQALDRLALLQNNVKAILTQTYELHEYPIPRLFICVVEPLDFFSNKFRLYFLCECGEHAKTANSGIPHHIHLAEHGGYDINRPNEFFQRYGFYVLTILRMLKFGISMARIAVPALNHLIRVGSLDQASKGLRVLENTIEPGGSSDDGRVAAGLAAQIKSSEALEGADLRQLESFLKKKDEDKVLGNLYRTVTAEGHVKWVCIHHYRENYREKGAKTFRNTVEAMQGSFDEAIGRVEVKLQSRVQAEQFYVALEKARSDTTHGDFKKLRNTLVITNIAVLELHLRQQQDGPVLDILNRNQRYDPILDIMQHPSIRSLTIRGLQDFSKRSNLHSRDDFSNLRHLDIFLDQLKFDIPSFTYLLSTTLNLSSLVVGVGNLSNDIPIQVFKAIAGYCSYPINFKEWNLCIPPPPRKSNQWSGCKSSNCTVTVDALVKATTNGSGFKEFQLTRTDGLSNSFIRNVSSVVARSELRSIDFYTRDEGRVPVLKLIQWEHLRQLRIWVNPGTFETGVLRAFVDGVKELSGKVDLEELGLYYDRDYVFDTPLSMPQEELLQDFIASTSLETLVLQVSMTLDKVLDLIKLADFSRLKMLSLWAKGFDSIRVKAILDGLQDATELKSLSLVHASITDEQKEQMSTKGVVLKNGWQLRE